MHGFFAHPEVAVGYYPDGTVRSARAAAYPGRMNQSLAAVLAAGIAARWFGAPHGSTAASTGAGQLAALTSEAVCEACEDARRQRPRFSSFRNLLPATDDELRAANLPQPAPPDTPAPRRPCHPTAANPWPPGAPPGPIAIEQLYRPGVYAAFEAWLVGEERPLQEAAAEARLPPDLAGWQSGARKRQHASGRDEVPGGKRARTYIIPNSDMSDWAAGTVWDTWDRDDCRPAEASHEGTVFPGRRQLNRSHARARMREIGWSDADLDDQLGSGLEARTGCARDTVVTRHHAGLFANFAQAAAVIQADIEAEWVRPPPKRSGGRPPHPPTVPCRSDPRDVILRMVSKVIREGDGSAKVVDIEKARVSSNLSSGGDASLNGGVPDEEKATALPTAQGLARAAAICQVAWQPPSATRKRPRGDSEQPPPRAPPPSRAADPPLEQPLGCLGDEPGQSRVPLVGMFALDLTSAYRFVPLQWLDLWCHCFLWLDEDGRLGFCTDRRLCFGGGYGPNRFERIATLIAASISRRLAAFDAAHPYPVDVQLWAAARREAQRRGELEAGEANCCPRAIQVYLDDFNAVGSLDSVPHPLGVAPLEYDAAAMLALGLRPVWEGCRLLAHAAIAVDEVGRFELEVAVPKTLVGSSIISLGLQPDVAEWSITVPEAKRTILIEHSRAFEAQVAAHERISRRDAERWTGRLCNVSQLLPELGALLHGGYTVATARERGGRRRLLDSVSLRADSRAGRDFADLAAVAQEVLGANEGVPLAAAATFPASSDPGVVTVVSDASGDVRDAGVGGFAFISDRPGVVYLVSEAWREGAAAAIAESQREPHMREGGPRLSMPAGELFATWATAAAALAEARVGGAVAAVIAVGDCAPAAAALNRASSPRALMRAVLRGARELSKQWLGVQVPRELNQRADALSHPSGAAAVRAELEAAGWRVELAAIPEPCWGRLAEALERAPADEADSPLGG